MKKQLKIVIAGKVQGVGFRRFVHTNAKRLSLNGTVRNTTDGNVEIIAEGEQRNLIKLLDNLKRGPPGSQVREVSHSIIEPSGTFSEFEILN